MKPKAYLAGKMTGLSFDTCMEWRNELTAMLIPTFEVLSPMRGQKKESFVEACAGACHMSFEMTRDLTDIERADVVVARFGFNEPVSLGTGVEIGTCIPLRRPVVFLFESPDDKLLGHPFIQAFPRGIITYTLEDVAYYLHSMFNV